MTVPRVEYVLDTSGAFPPGGTWSTAVRVGASEGIRKALALVERHHKERETRRAAPGVPAIPEYVTRRTGALSRSYSIRYVNGQLQGTYGSDLKRARLLEEGGTVNKVSKRGIAFKAHYEPRPGVKRTAIAKSDEVARIIADAIKKAMDDA